ncbi:MAG: hypothetical protein HJJLKODD_00915 [Phycisphaerae bacterium]|nr:hypothetical protein [Phycisphaerae bacterium]
MRWMWIDRFVAFESGRRAVAVKCVSRAEDHLHDNYPAYPLMPATLIIEGMAQTAGVLVGEARQFADRVVLAKVPRATFAGDVLPGDTLQYEARLERIDDAGAMTSGQVQCNGRPLGEIDIVFSHLPRETADQLGIPSHNFVFHDDFRRLLAAFGLDMSRYPTAE